MIFCVHPYIDIYLIEGAIHPNAFVCPCSSLQKRNIKCVQLKFYGFKEALGPELPGEQVYLGRRGQTRREAGSCYRQEQEQAQEHLQVEGQVGKWEIN